MTEQNESKPDISAVKQAVIDEIVEVQSGETVNARIPDESASTGSEVVSREFEDYQSVSGNASGGVDSAGGAIDDQTLSNAISKAVSRIAIPITIAESLSDVIAASKVGQGQEVLVREAAGLVYDAASGALVVATTSTVVTSFPHSQA